MLSSKQINALGQILNASWGKSGSEYNCVAKFDNDAMRIMYSSVVYLASEKSMNSQIPSVALEAAERINSKMADTKKQYKELTGSALKVKEIKNEDDVQYIQASSVNPRKVVLYRKFVDFQLS